jgi:hypothetical protein
VSNANLLEVFRLISCAETNVADFLVSLRDYIAEAGREPRRLLLYLIGWLDTQVLENTIPPFHWFQTFDTQ